MNYPDEGGFDWAASATLPEFLKGIAPLEKDECRTIIYAARLLLTQYYVHLPEKRRIHDIDPAADLDQLSQDLPIDGVGFHTRLCGIFASLRDLHTQYMLPACYQQAACILPFKIGMYEEDGQARCIVTDVQRSYPWLEGHTGFGQGAEILTWCGEPIAVAVARAASATGGANPAAAKARALASMTIRPLERQPPPASPTICLTYAASEGAPSSLELPWHVVDVALEARDPSLARFVGIDHEAEARRHVSTKVYHPCVAAAARLAISGGRHAPYPWSPALATSLPSVLLAHELGGRYGYIRIFSFHPPAAAVSIEALLRTFTLEFVRLIASLPPDGLVIDVRGNGGGFLPLAESLLQTLVDKPITPQSVDLLATHDVLELSRRSQDLGQFVPSLEHAISTGGDYSDALPMTDPAWCNWHERSYHGPVVLLTDARCYSATDAFAAGFQDHRIGTIIGVSPSTGAGGANVWTLREFLDMGAATALAPLPQGASLRVALRRTHRVKANFGKLVEEVGVAAEIVHTLTRRDLLENDGDLLECAMKTLDAM